MKAVCIHVALYGLVFAVVSGCDQPKPNCLTAQSAFVMKLVEESRSGTCEGFGPKSFYADPHVGIAPYYERDKKGQPDYRKGSVAIRTAELANLVATAEEQQEGEVSFVSSDTVLHSLGKFVTEEPDGNDFCVAPVLSPTVVKIDAVPPREDDPATPKVDETFPGQPAVNVRQTWSELKVYVTPASFGTQVQAKLRDVRRTEEGESCTINYNAFGLAPAVSCQKLDEEDAPITKPDGTFETDPTLCSPEANPALGRFTGSGISPSTKFECDATIGYCVLSGTSVPALQ